MYDYSGLSYQHIEYFIAIAEQGTMQEAAKLLHVTPPLLSQKIRQLERIIDIQLFERSRQRLYLTEAGKRLLVDLKRILLDISTVLDAARESHDAYKELTIGLTNYHDDIFVDFILGEARKMCPDLDFKMEILPRAQLQEDFLEKKIDIICVTDFDDIHKTKGVASKTAFTSEVGCYANIDSSYLRGTNEFRWKDLVTANLDFTNSAK